MSTLSNNAKRDEGFYWVSIPGLDGIDGLARDKYNAEKFNITNVTVKRNANAIKSPVETGYYVFDNKVLMPLEVTMSAVVCERNWDEVWSILLQIYNERSYNFYTVYTRGELIDNLMLVELTREETTDKFDAVDITLHFTQVVYTSEAAKEIADKKDQATKKTGQKNFYHSPSIVGGGVGQFFTGGSFF